MRGTSPVVSGFLALVLQRRPDGSGSLEGVRGLHLEPFATEQSERPTDEKDDQGHINSYLWEGEPQS